MFKVADAHCDYLNKVMERGYDIIKPKPGQTIILENMRSGGVALQFFAAWLNKDYSLPVNQQLTVMTQAYKDMLECHETALGELTKAFDFNAGRIATVLTVEDLGALGRCDNLLPLLCSKGVRAVTLTWNYNNILAGSSMDEGNKGLSPYGKEMVALLNERNIAIDVSHLSDRGIDDLLTISSRPVFASHSNARACINTPRALQDAHIREIAKRNGVIGVNFCHLHLAPKPKADVSDVIRHILHIYKIGGSKCCAIGSDYDGIDVCPTGLETSADMQHIAIALLKDGLDEQAVANILFGNLYNYIIQYL